MLDLYGIIVIIKPKLSRSSMFWNLVSFKGPILGVRKILTTETTLKMMKNVFYFMTKALSILEILIFLSWLFGYEEKRFDEETNVNFKIYGNAD